MDNDQEIITQENDIEVEEIEEEATGEQDTPEIPDTSEVDELNKKLATAEAQKNHWKKKATAQKGKAEAKTEELSSKDLYALMSNKVPEEDVDDVIKAAKALDMPIIEALNSNIVKTILSDSKEKRNSADVANTSNTRMGPTPLSDEALIANAEKGDIPDDQESIDRLIAAKQK